MAQESGSNLKATNLSEIFYEAIYLKLKWKGIKYLYRKFPQHIYFSNPQLNNMTQKEIVGTDIGCHKLV